MKRLLSPAELVAYVLDGGNLIAIGGSILAGGEAVADPEHVEALVQGGAMRRQPRLFGCNYELVAGVKRERLTQLLPVDPFPAETVVAFCVRADPHHGEGDHYCTLDMAEAIGEARRLLAAAPKMVEILRVPMPRAQWESYVAKGGLKP